MVYVAKSIGVSHSVISKIENGRYPFLSLSILLKLANHYNMSITEILQIKEDSILEQLSLQ